MTTHITFQQIGCTVSEIIRRSGTSPKSEMVKGIRAITKFNTEAGLRRAALDPRTRQQQSPLLTYWETPRAAIEKECSILGTSFRIFCSTMGSGKIGQGTITTE